VTLPRTLAVRVFIDGIVHRRMTENETSNINGFLSKYIGFSECV